MKTTLLLFCLLATTTGGCPLVPPAPIKNDPVAPRMTVEGEIAANFIAQYSRDVDTKVLSKIYAGKLQVTCEEIAKNSQEGKYFDLKALEEDWGKRAKADLQSSWEEFRQDDRIRSAHRGASGDLTATMNKLSGKESTDSDVSLLFSKLAAGFKKAAQ